ncbi:ATP-binding cassette domain-containing protein [Chromohalobacter beijerinckii]|uniref:ATP-binding cassette domain-containing protein n=1 Tax=Chromohalobacter beijerinckii TaxID=86179 RepID=A0ABV8XBH5_9GAMM|nr:energy-coupling factor ABC transporter ATP-binding protein [Chromohalobacter beijerinckii]MCK0765222.1 energy-coupling factor ABC transporter ATP-binding protein [Chromohalobacter beijerinckii]
MLEVSHLAHGFDRQPALWDIPYLYWQGRSLVHLRGDNGSGKTTLLRLLAGLEAPRQGTIHWTLAGAMSAVTPPCPGRVLYLHQQPYLFDTSVAGNLRYVARWHGWRGEMARDRVAAMLEHCGLAAHAEQRARSLSGGERMRLALARAWLLSPRVLLLDEPTASLDRQAIADVSALISSLHEVGCAIVLSAHQPSVLTERCDEYWSLEQRCLQVSAFKQGVAV